MENVRYLDLDGTDTGTHTEKHTNYTVHLKICVLCINFSSTTKFKYSNGRKEGKDLS